MKIKRREAKVIKIGKLKIGGSNPVAIQSMCNTKTQDVQATVAQIKQLEACGCDIVRLALRDMDDAAALRQIKDQVSLPLVADIHFDYRLALEAINSGVDKIRLNPGNIYKKEELSRIAQSAKSRHIPIRVGLNSGSLPSKQRHKSPARRPNTVAAQMADSALEYIKVLEGCGFYDIVVSLKASNILDTIEAYREISGLCDYPLHLGVTATGEPFSGAIKSAVAVGALLLEGIGDTIRISLTDSPPEEVKSAKAILSGLGLRHFGHEIISCPTCGRCEVDLIKIVKDLENKLTILNLKSATAKPLKVAVMGCVVNGPGEAASSDIGIAFGKKDGLLFKKGQPLKKVSFKDCVNVLLKEIGDIGD